LNETVAALVPPTAKAHAKAHGGSRSELVALSDVVDASGLSVSDALGSTAPSRRPQVALVADVESKRNERRQMEWNRTECRGTQVAFRRGRGVEEERPAANGMSGLDSTRMTQVAFGADAKKLAKEAARGPRDLSGVSYGRSGHVEPNSKEGRQGGGWNPWEVTECTVLYCTVLYCTVLCCAVLCCHVLSCDVLTFQRSTIFQSEPGSVPRSAVSSSIAPRSKRTSSPLSPDDTRGESRGMNQKGVKGGGRARARMRWRGGA
jgi:hypothetical protein